MAGSMNYYPLKNLPQATPYYQKYLSLWTRQGLLDAVKIGQIWYSSKNAVEQYLSKHRKKDV
jgi:hypothetical protein